jgi:GcvH upstream region-like protein
MLQFLRRYQKVIFFFTTILIVSSFVFFGTFNTFTQTASAPDPVVYTTRLGTKVRQSEMQMMMQFLSNERLDPVLPRNLLENNFLNHGFVSKELLKSDGVEAFVSAKEELHAGELSQAFEKEKVYAPYRSTLDPNLSAEAIWSFIAPEINENLQKLRKAKDWKEALPAKVNLYLAQRHFSPAMLTQTLLYSSAQSPAGMDPRLMKGDLSLFHYRNLQDWFGEAFMERSAKCIFEAVDSAKKRGLKVTKEERDHYLHNLLVETYKEVAPHVKDQIPHPFALYQLYLRHRGWTQAAFEANLDCILLGLRLLDHYSKVPLVDNFSFEDFHSYAYEYATVKVKEIPESLRLTKVDEWEAFEGYIQATSSLVTDKEFSLESHPYEIIAAKSPYLVGREVSFYYNEVSLKQLEGRVSLKETWAWEKDLANHASLKKTFPELASGEEAWENKLENLPKKRRQAVDSFARAEIAKMHPEWVEDAFQKTTMNQTALLVARSGECCDFPLKGINDIPAFMDKISNEKEFVSYTQDGVHFYRILRTQEMQPERLFTFSECRQIGVHSLLVRDYQGKERFDSIQHKFNAKEQVELCQHRFDFLLKLDEDEKLSAYGMQFQPSEKIVTLSRVEPSNYDVDEIFSSKLGDPSLPKIFSGMLCSYEVMDHQVDTSAPVKQVSEMQTKLHQELRYSQLKRFLMQFTNA